MEFHTANLALATALFVIGAAGALAKRNAISVLMCIELMLNGANLAIIAFAAHAGGAAAPGMAAVESLDGSLIVLFVVAVAAAEAAVGLGIFVMIFRNQRRIDADRMEALRG